MRSDTDQAPSAVDRLLASLVGSGSRAAAYTLTARAQAEGQVLADRVLLDDQVLARTTSVQADGEAVEVVEPLWRVVERVIAGANLVAIERPEPQLLFWQAVTSVRLDAPGPRRRLRSGVIARSVEATAMVVVSAADRRGLGGVVWADDERADAFVRRVTSAVPAARARLGRVRAQLNAGTSGGRLDAAFKSVMAAAITARLDAADARRGADGAVPSLDWVVMQRDEVGRLLQVVSSPRSSTDRRPYTRTNRLFDAIVADADEELGHGRAGPKAVVPEPLSLDAVGDDQLSLGEVLAGRGDPTERIELAELLTDLSSRQRTAVNLRLAGHSYDEIAEAMGISPGTVGATLSAARKKLEATLGPT